MSEVEGREDAGTEEAHADTGGTGETRSDAVAEPRRPKVKIKVPPAQQIARGDDFTPHALGSKGRPAPRSGTRAAAKKRRILYTTGGVVVVAALVGAMVVYANRPKPSVKIHGAFGKAPVVSVPKAAPSPKMQVKELIHGSGTPVSTGAFVVAHMVAYKWNKSGGKELANTFKKGQPLTGTGGQMIGLPALDKELTGRKTGSRVELTLPYAKVGDQLGQQLQLAHTDDLVFSVDLLGVFGKTAAAQGTPQKVDSKLPQVTAGKPGAAPAIKIPSGSPPAKQENATLIQGSGPAVRKGQTLVAQYEGMLWRNGKVFDSSWQHGAPAAFPIGVKQVIPGWDDALVGAKAGSRMLLVIPPAEGYGSKGQAQAGIKGTDTLVFVVDILGSY